MGLCTKILRVLVPCHCHGLVQIHNEAAASKEMASRKWHWTLESRKHQEVVGHEVAKLLPLCLPLSGFPCRLLQPGLGPTCITLRATQSLRLFCLPGKTKIAMAFKSNSQGTCNPSREYKSQYSSSHLASASTAGMGKSIER